MSYLVIQGLEVETPDLKEIAKLSGSTRIEGIGNNAFRLHDYKTRDGVAAYCANAKLDFAFVPQPRKLSDYTLSNTLEMKNGKLTGKVLGRIVDAQIKAAKLRELRDALRLSREQIIAFGDGANDLAMMAEAGVSIAYHAKPLVREKATYCFDYVGLDGLLYLYA